MTDADDELLERASRFAFEIARADHLAKPRRPVPGALRRHVGFARIPPATLRVVRRVVDDDTEFRARVAEEANESAVGRAGLLWLTRPDGWDIELDGLREFLTAADKETADRRRINQLDTQLAQLGDELASAQAAHALTSAELVEMGDARDHAEAETDRVRSELAELRDERNHSVREWKRIERLRNEERAEVAAARTRLDEPVADAVGSQRSEAAMERVRSARQALADVEAEMNVVRSDLVDIERRLAAALDGVARALTELAEPVPAPEVELSAPARSGPPAPPGLGRGLLDDTVEAADALARTPDLTFLIDGYNLTLGAMPDVPLGEGRDRLVAALDDLHARTSARSVVVFDGSEPGAGSGRSRWVQVRFTDHAVEADDFLIDLVSTWSGTGPLVVVSSDNRVRDGVRVGARPLASRAFAQYLGLA
ncbi:MAG: hypothetical protein GY698_13720 [Actinomycetia bacterium]|nr:hypothetical protein [Actinomycetes bacterium]